VLPDILNHNAVDPVVMDRTDLTPEQRSKLIGEWFGKVGAPDAKIPIIDAVIKELKEKHGVEKFGVIGFCYGGRLSAVLAATDKVHGSVICHPAPLKVPEEIEAIKQPTLWICAETDNTFPIPTRKAAEEVLVKKGGAKFTFKDYPGTTHGFACRGDPKNPTIEKAKIDALQEAIHFFKHELK